MAFTILIIADQSGSYRLFLPFCVQIGTQKVPVFFTLSSSSTPAALNFFVELVDFKEYL